MAQRLLHCHYKETKPLCRIEDGNNEIVWTSYDLVVKWFEDTFHF
jgi:hypothetical protein